MWTPRQQNRVHVDGMSGKNALEWVEGCVLDGFDS